MGKTKRSRQKVVLNKIKMLKSKILNRESGIVFYGLTPPKVSTPEERIPIIANKQIERIKNLDIDGLILYDIQDESSRTNAPRPFPFLSTISPEEYSANHLKALPIPKIIYKSVGKQSKSDFKEWLANRQEINFGVFVGAPSKEQKINLSLHEAYTIKKEAQTNIILGGVTIPERHQNKGDEHLRVFDKIERGCQFFISQCVYNLDNAISFLSDYYYWSQKNEKPLVPIIFTLTPCGSLKTLEFMNWLGIDIPKWLKTELEHSENILLDSVETCKKIAEELISYADKKNIPIGFNIESVAIRKEEIDASITLLKDVKKMVSNM